MMENEGQHLDKNYFVILDDDPSISLILEKILDYPVKSYTDPKQFINEYPKLNPLGAFIDVHIGPETNGIELLSTIRGAWQHCPIIIITADHEEELIKNALNSGADDFMKKPLNPIEVNARLNLRIRDINQKKSKDTIQIFDLKINRNQRTISGPKGERFLTPMDVSIFLEFHRSKENAVKRQALKQNCWGSSNVTDNALNRKLFEIRKIISDTSDETTLKTIYGVGFTIENMNS